MGRRAETALCKRKEDAGEIKREVAGGGRVCKGMRRRQTRCMSTHDVLLTEGFPS